MFYRNHPKETIHRLFSIDGRKFGAAGLAALVVTASLVVSLSEITSNGIYQTAYAEGGYTATKIVLSGVDGAPVFSAFSIAKDNTGNIYIADAARSVAKVDSDGNLLQRFCNDASFETLCDVVRGVSVDGMGNVYVSDPSHARILKFDSEGNLILTITRTGVSNPFFAFDSALDLDGNLYVADNGNNEIVKFNAAGEVIQTIPLSSTHVYVSLDGAGNIYANTASHILKFDPSGNLLQQYCDSVISIASCSGPTGATIDTAGNLYVADTGNQRVVKFDSAGNMLTEFRQSFTDSLFAPNDLIVDPTGDTVLVGDRNGRLITFSRSSDTTPPVISVPSGLDALTTHSQGAVVTFDVTATDDVGVTSGPACTPASGSLFPVGETVVSCTASDAAGNTGTASFTVTVRRVLFSGVLNPINADGSSIFKLKSTVPIKFQLQDEHGNSITDLQATLRIAKITDQVMGTEMEGESTSAADTGSVFRIQSNQYVYNWGTDGLSEGTWAIKIYLNYDQQSQLLLDNDLPSDQITAKVSLK